MPVKKASIGGDYATFLPQLHGLFSVISEDIFRNHRPYKSLESNADSKE
jgi:hypothetical protein